MLFRTWAVAAAALGMTGAQAAGFALIEQNASGLGNAYAGQAAAAEDAGTIFFNPAGLTEVEGGQAIAALHLIRPSARYRDNLGAASGGDAGGLAAVPNLYFATDLNPDLKLGIGLGSPFGLKTEYDRNWAGRAKGILSDLKTINLNPTLAWRAGERLSLGVGIDFQFIRAELTKEAAPGVVTSLAGDDTGWGYNLGALLKVDDKTRVGASFRSGIKHKLRGDLNANIAVLPGVGALPQSIHAHVELPDSASLAVHHRLDERWSVLADVGWTGWSVFQKLEARLTSNNAIVDLTPENWEDAWRLGLGATCRGDGRWSWRFGVALDQTPVPDAAHRTPRIPDEDRVWVAFGGQYRLGRGNALDFGYAHLFVRDAAIDTPAGAYDNAVDILSIQYTHGF